MNGEAGDPMPAGPKSGSGKKLGLTCSCWIPFGSSDAGALGALEVAMGIEGRVCALAAAIALILLVVAVVDRWLLGGGPGTLPTLGGLRGRWEGLIRKGGDMKWGDLMAASVLHVKHVYLSD